MRFTTTAIAALALPAFAVAQIYGPPPGPAPASPSSSTSSAPAVPTAPPSTQGFMNVGLHSL